MRQITIGHCDSSEPGSYKVTIGENSSNAMSFNQEQRRELKKPKRFRSAFTTEQINYLEELFKRNPYIDRDQRQEVARMLRMDERPIKIWYQNRRMKEKKENPQDFEDQTSGTPQNFVRNKLGNMSAFPLANAPHLYSLPVLSSTADTSADANSDSEKEQVNINDSIETQKAKPESHTASSIENKNTPPKANFYKEVNSQDYVSPFFHQEQNAGAIISSAFASEEKFKKPHSRDYLSNSSAEFSINLCKKYKQQCTSTNAAGPSNITDEDQEKKSEAKHSPKVEIKPSTSTKYSLPNNESEELDSPHKLAMQMQLNNPVYYSAISNMYSSAPPINSLPPPYMAPDGVLWKPVNYMPIMAPNPPPMNNMGHWPHPTHEPKKNCNCNCHGSSQQLPATLPPGAQNPYGQYVFTVPFPPTSSNFKQ